MVESKNGSVIRKQFGYAHIAQHFAADLNAFCRDFLNPYVNSTAPATSPPRRSMPRARSASATRTT
ncbi:MAG: hypothetical protein IPG28_12300 [Betaproteobacteria bacterium]|nr:hypothetical protein [Betaproteobacteria bacterium]